MSIPLRLPRAVSTTQALDFTYDSSGLRTSKTVDGVTHKYLYAGGKLMRETYGSNTLDFFYDANGTPYALKYNGTVYYYITNLQGDVIQIVDASGNAVATYEYDPYGKVISATGTLAETNPIRYRGYYYDTETGLYYLQSRYYDSEIFRFVNADSLEILFNTYDSAIQYNQFAYCWNNPVNKFDQTGYYPLMIAGYGYITSSFAYGAANFWNPSGWVVLSVSIAAVAIPTVIYVAKSYTATKSKSKSNPDPYARPGQKKQGRERKNKSRQSDNWKPRSNPKPPKKHTPGRDHRKFK